MCKGPIVASTDRSKDTDKSRFGLTEFFKKFLEKITCSSVRSDQSQTNMCLKCGDLEIDDNWLRIPHPSKARISEAIKSGSIIINGRLTVCHFCRAVVEKGHREYIRVSSDFQLGFVHPTSTMSF